MPAVKPGFFPLDEQLQLGAHSWTPETVKQRVNLGVEIPSYRRAAQNYVELTQVGVSKSQLGELAKTYGGKMVQQPAAEAEAMVKPPTGDEIIVPRAMPQPDSEVMALSMDGALVNIRGEGWKEVKTVAISAVETVVNIVMQERMKQAGRRWSRNNAQAMLALRSILLSDRWNEVWATLTPSPKLA